MLYWLLKEKISPSEKPPNSSYDKTKLIYLLNIQQKKEKIYNCI